MPGSIRSIDCCSPIRWWEWSRAPAAAGSTGRQTVPPPPRKTGEVQVAEPVAPKRPRFWLLGWPTWPGPDFGRSIGIDPDHLDHPRRPARPLLTKSRQEIGRAPRLNSSHLGISYA